MSRLDSKTILNLIIIEFNHSQPMPRLHTPRIIEQPVEALVLQFHNAHVDSSKVSMELDGIPTDRLPLWVLQVTAPVHVANSTNHSLHFVDVIVPAL